MATRSAVSQNLIENAGDILTIEELTFVEAYTSGMSAAQALRRAGYSEATAVGNPTRVLGIPRVKKAIDERVTALKARAEVTRDDVVRGFMRAIEDAKLTSDPMAQISGWREIGKMLGHYEAERVEIKLSPVVEEATQQLQSMDTEQLLALAGPDIIDADFSLVVEEDEAA